MNVLYFYLTFYTHLTEHVESPRSDVQFSMTLQKRGITLAGN